MSAMDFQSPEALQDPLQLSPFWRCNILHLTLQLSAITLCNKYLVQLDGCDTQPSNCLKDARLGVRFVRAYSPFVWDTKTGSVYCPFPELYKAFVDVESLYRTFHFYMWAPETKEILSDLESDYLDFLDSKDTGSTWKAGTVLCYHAFVNYFKIFV